MPPHLRVNLIIPPPQDLEKMLDDAYETGRREALQNAAQAARMKVDAMEEERARLGAQMVALESYAGELQRAAGQNPDR